MARNDSVYYDYNPWWDREYDKSDLIERTEMLDLMDHYFQMDLIVLLTGLRRIGKTSLLKLFIKRLIEKGIDSRKIFYVSMDDYLLDSKSVIEIVDDFRRIQRMTKDSRIYLFLDEIAGKEDFHQQLKNLYDKFDVKIFTTSSSSSVLRDKSAFLTGRERILEVLPLDFQEYLVFINVTISERDEPLRESYFAEFLETGGIPGYVLSRDREYITTLVDDIVYKDIIAFHNIRNHRIIRDMFQLLVQSSCGPASIYKLSRTLKVSSETAWRYLNYFVDTWLLYLVSHYGKTKVKLTSPHKVYVSDIGIRSLFSGSPILGKQFENYVFLKLKHLDPCYVYENKTELDFIIKNSFLAEIKYNAELKSNQKVLFDQINVPEKYVIKNLNDLLDLEKRLKQQ